METGFAVMKRGNLWTLQDAGVGDRKGTFRVA